MNELCIRVRARTSASGFEEPGVEARLPLFHRPARHTLETPELPQPIAALELRFPVRGTRFVLETLEVRAEDGPTLYRWAGSGSLFRGARGLRLSPAANGVLVECLEADGAVTVELDPATATSRVELLLRIAAEPAAAPPPAGPEPGGSELATVLQRLVQLEQRLDAEALERRDELGQIHRSLEWMRVRTDRRLEMSARRAEADALAIQRLVELQGQTFGASIDEALTRERHLLAQREQELAQREQELTELHARAGAMAAQLQAIQTSKSWVWTRPMRGALRVARGEIPVGAASARLTQAVLRRTPGGLGLLHRYERMTAERRRAAALRTRPAQRLSPPGPVSFPTAGAIAWLPDLTGEVPQPLDVSISVVIPTYNAGAEFHWLLRKLQAQKAIRSVQIVVVDSGSSDGTDLEAETAGCTVVRIPNSDFSHSYARNLGADNATGELLVFMVQDAYPVGDHWLYAMARALTQPRDESERVAAVSCAEHPRSDSELFYEAGIDTHYRFLGCHDGDRVGAFAGADHTALRTQGQLSDVACMIPRETFEAYRYQGRYAEDLILGVRLIRDGLRTGMLSSVKVIHSHNRKPAYYLKRTFVDVIFLVEVFPDFTVPPAYTIAGALAAGVALRRLAEDWVPPENLPPAEALRDLARQARGLRVETAGARLTDATYGLAALHRWVEAAARAEPAIAGQDVEQVRNMFIDRLQHLAGYVERVYSRTDPLLAEQLSAAAQKTAAAVIGSQLAFLYIHRAKAAIGDDADRLQGLRDTLLAGI